MKQTILLSLLLILAVLLLPATLLPPAPEAPPAESVSLDREITFTVKTDQGIASTTMEAYLPGVIAGEMPALFETQALMAQAVAARTYIIHRILRGTDNHPEADICNDPGCCKAYADSAKLHENWGDQYDNYYAKLSQAAADTDGQYLSYEGQPIEAVFHSSSSGATEDSGSIWNRRPYLVSVDSPETAEEVPNYVTETTFSPELLRRQFSDRYPEMRFGDDPAFWIQDPVRNESGRIQSATVGGISLSGPQIRSALALRSTAFTLDYAEGVFTFVTTGYGHGVGMSQYGANSYAKQGWTYQEILDHYYPNTQLTSWTG